MTLVPLKYGNPALITRKKSTVCSQLCTFPESNKKMSGFRTITSRIGFNLGVLLFSVPFFLGILVVLVIYGFLFLYKKGHEGVTRILRPDLLEILSPVAQLMANDNLRHFPQFNICVCLNVETSLSVEEVSSKFRRKVLEHLREDNGELEYAKLQQYWVKFGGFWYWKVEEDFRLENHIRFYDGEEGGGDTGGDGGGGGEEEQGGGGGELADNVGLLKISSTLLTDPWKEKTSPWELVLTNSKERAEGIFTFRFNHGLADGLSALRLLKQLNEWESDDEKEFESRAGGWGWRTLARLPYDLVSDTFRFLCNYSVDSNCWMESSKEKFAGNAGFVNVAGTVPLGKIKEIRRNFQVSFNTVLATIATGAVRELMTGSKHLPEKITIFVPVTLPRHPGGLCIHTNAILIRMPVKESDPAKRLEQISKIKIGKTLPALSHFFANIGGLLPIFITRSIKLLGVTMGMTAIQGPSEHGLLFGHRVSKIHFCVGTGPGTGGATLSVTSYGQEVAFLLTLKQRLSSPNVHLHFRNYILEEVERLLKAGRASINNTV